MTKPTINISLLITHLVRQCHAIKYKTHLHHLSHLLIHSGIVSLVFFRGRLASLRFHQFILLHSLFPISVLKYKTSKKQNIILCYKSNLNEISWRHGRSHLIWSEHSPSSILSMINGCISYESFSAFLTFTNCLCDGLQSKTQQKGLVKLIMGSTELV